MLLFETYCEALRAQLAAAGIANGNVEKHHGIPVDDEDLPFASVTWGNDHGTHDGDPATGAPTFLHKTLFAVDLYARGNDFPSVRAALGAASETILQTLLGNLAWGGTTLVGIAGVRQTIDLPVEGNFHLLRLQVQIDVLTQSQWYAALDPVTPFTQVDVTLPDGGAGIGMTVPLPQT